MKLQQLAEEKIGVLIVFTLLVVSVGLLIEVVPLAFTKAATQPVPGVKPYNALQVAGRDIFVREGCYNCHSQMIRPFRAETERYGHYSVAGESVYDHPFQWGSKRTGPDLARVGGRYSDEWHRIHLLNPRDVVPESNMPAFPWLARNKVDVEATVLFLRYGSSSVSCWYSILSSTGGTRKTTMMPQTVFSMKIKIHKIKKANTVDIVITEQNNEHNIPIYQ